MWSNISGKKSRPFFFRLFRYVQEFGLLNIGVYLGTTECQVSSIHATLFLAGLEMIEILHNSMYVYVWNRLKSFLLLTDGEMYGNVHSWAEDNPADSLTHLILRHPMSFSFSFIYLFSRLFSLCSFLFIFSLFLFFSLSFFSAHSWNARTMMTIGWPLAAVMSPFVSSVWHADIPGVVPQVPPRDPPGFQVPRKIPETVPTTRGKFLVSKRLRIGMAEPNLSQDDQISSDLFSFFNAVAF